MARPSRPNELAVRSTRAIPVMNSLSNSISALFLFLFLFQVLASAALFAGGLYLLSCFARGASALDRMADAVELWTSQNAPVPNSGVVATSPAPTSAPVVSAPVVSAPVVPAPGVSAPGVPAPVVSAPLTAPEAPSPALTEIRVSDGRVREELVGDERAVRDDSTGRAAQHRESNPGGGQ